MANSAAAERSRDYLSGRSHRRDIHRMISVLSLEGNPSGRNKKRGLVRWDFFAPPPQNRLVCKGLTATGERLVKSARALTDIMRKQHFRREDSQE